MTLSSSDVLFVGSGNSALSWYRCGMPSLTLGCDYVGVVGPPTPAGLKIMTALKRGPMDEIDWLSYKIVILQQPYGTEWLSHIKYLRSRGIKVFYEIDDYVQGVRKVRNHAAARKYTKRHCELMEICMRACDGMIVSTPFLASRYRRFNTNIWLCRNSIEGRRYNEFTPPDRGRDVIHVGWAGGEGHWDDVVAWLPAIERLLAEDERVIFGTIGKRVASELDPRFREQGRVFELPFVSIENYPGALCNFDLAIAPAGRNDFFKGKSDLRWLECGALGIPVVADPFVYDEVEEPRTGLLASTADEAYSALRRLIDHPAERQEIAANARQHVMERRTIEVMCEQWVNVFRNAF